MSAEDIFVREYSVSELDSYGFRDIQDELKKEGWVFALSEKVSDSRYKLTFKRTAESRREAMDEYLKDLDDRLRYDK